jgi:hypothetical protein
MRRSWIAMRYSKEAVNEGYTEPSSLIIKSDIEGGSKLLIDSMFLKASGRLSRHLAKALHAMLDASMKTCH